MKLKRITSRFFFHVFKTLIILVSYVNHRLYMKLYVPYLKFYGMNLKGFPRYIAKNASFDDFDKITLSDRVVISGQVRFLTHDYSYTTALIASGHVVSTDIAIVRPIVIGKNVFIGAKSFVLPGTIIGDNCIIGAGSVVRGTIPSRSVCIGNPAKVISSIDELYQKWSEIDVKNLRKD